VDNSNYFAAYATFLTLGTFGMIAGVIYFGGQSFPPLDFIIEHVNALR
jgi:hypothetical protein